MAYYLIQRPQRCGFKTLQLLRVALPDFLRPVGVGQQRAADGYQIKVAAVEAAQQLIQ